MTISSLSPADYYDNTASSSTKSKSSDPLQQVLTSLESDLASGDTTDAASTLSDILSKAPNATGGTTGTDSSSNSSSSTDPITKYLKEIKSAIASGDTSNAQSLVTSLQKYVTDNPPPMPPNGGSNSGGGSSTNGNPLEQALTSLSSDLSSGDTTDASTVLSDLISHTSHKSDSSSTDSTTTADSSSSTNSTSGSSNELTTYFKSILSALSSGDTTSAESLVTTLQNYLTANQPAPASGTYSADGSILSDTTTTNSISALA